MQELNSTTGDSETESTYLLNAAQGWGGVH